MMKKFKPFLNVIIIKGLQWKLNFNCASDVMVEFQLKTEMAEQLLYLHCKQFLMEFLQMKRPPDSR